jgi:hypothetical protein
MAGLPFAFFVVSVEMVVPWLRMLPGEVSTAGFPTRIGLPALYDAAFILP